MTENNARTAAVSALLKVEENEGFSNIVIDKELSSSQMERRDRALASAIFYGVLEKKLLLDFYLSHFAKPKGGKTDRTVDMILRAAAYQILFLSKIPHSAAVNEAVGMTKTFGRARASGYVNAVLRALLRGLDEIELPPGDSDAALSVRYSVPEELISLWKRSYGDKNALNVLEAFSKRRGLYVRVNTLKTDTDAFSKMLNDGGVTAVPSGICESALELIGASSVAELPGFEEGLFHVQDLSAQLVCRIASPKPGSTVCDACAAPGGKSFTMAQMMKNSGRIDSFDLYKGRVGLIKKGAERLSIDIINAAQADMSVPAPGGAYDLVLCDAPCSGYGTISGKPEIRYKKLSDVCNLPELQYNILCGVSGRLKKGGILIYSTCTLNPQENGRVAERFLSEHPDFEPYNIVLPPGIERTFEEPGNQLTIFPFYADSDGFFVSSFRRA